MSEARIDLEADPIPPPYPSNDESCSMPRNPSIHSDYPTYRTPVTGWVISYSPEHAIPHEVHAQRHIMMIDKPVLFESWVETRGRDWFEPIAIVPVLLKPMLYPSTKYPSAVLSKSACVEVGQYSRKHKGVFRAHYFAVREWWRAWHYRICTFLDLMHRILKYSRPE